MKFYTFPSGLLRTNTYFCVGEGGACVVIDPGPDGEKVFAQLEKKGLKPSHILLTHGHFDHSLGAKALAEKTGAKICVHEDDAEMLSDLNQNGAELIYRGRTVPYPDVQADVLFQDGSELTCGELSFRVIHTPGHSKGSVCYASEDKLFSGDLLFSGGYGRIDLYGSDREEMIRSLLKLKDLPDATQLYPGHGNSMSLSKERRNIENYVRWLGLEG